MLFTFRASPLLQGFTYSTSVSAAEAAVGLPVGWHLSVIGVEREPGNDAMAWLYA